MLFDTGNGAVFSECRTWRYVLYRQWNGDGPWMCWVMLNPSTADEETDDATIRRCISRARGLGYGGILVCNLFAFRTAWTSEMMAAPDPVGPGNDVMILNAAWRSEIIVAAWGVHGAYRNRAREVLDLLKATTPALWCLGTTKRGAPRHPLYVADAVELERFEVRRHG